MKTIRFQSPEESQAWAICFASQCPRVVEAPGGVSPAVAEKRSKALEAEFARAGNAADAMIRAWRERAYGSPEPLDAEYESADVAPEAKDEDAAAGDVKPAPPSYPPELEDNSKFLAG